jgi:hypothetical protein
MAAANWFWIAILLYSRNSYNLISIIALHRPRSLGAGQPVCSERIEVLNALRKISLDNHISDGFTGITRMECAAKNKNRSPPERAWK